MKPIRNRQHLSIYHWFLVIALLVTCVGCNADSSSAQRKAPKAVQGTLNLEHVDAKQVITLDGEWGFYWKRLIDPNEVDKVRPDAYVKVPDAWSNYQMPDGKPNPAGYATYILHVQHEEPNKVWAIDIPPLSSAYSLWVDGKLLLQSGRVGAPSEVTVAHIEQQVVTFESTNRSIDIVMQVSNDMHPRGGITRSIKLGDPKRIISNQQVRLAFELFLSGALFIMAVYHLGLFVMRRKDKAALYFGIYCFVIALRSLIVGETIIYKIIPSLNWVLVLKIEYLCFCLGALFFTAFVQAIYPKEVSLRIFRFIIAVYIIYIAIILGGRPHLFTSLLFYVQFMIIVFLGYGFIVILKAIIRRREGAVLFSVGGAILTVSTINDILFSRGVLQTGNYMTLGLFAFVVAQSFILGKKFSKALTNSEEMAKELRRLNNSLERKVMERTNELIEMNEVLRIQSSLDGLTGLANRGYFDQVMETMLSNTAKHGGVLSLLLVDIDYFKAYNDNYGHLQGDECLRQVASLLQAEAKTCGGLAARYGGEEFAVIVPVDAAAAAQLASELVRHTSDLGIEHLASMTAPFITISCGVTTYTVGVNGEPSMHSLIESADEALYKVKRQGRNGYSVAEASFAESE